MRRVIGACVGAGVLRRQDTRPRFDLQGGEPAVDTPPASYAKLLRAEYGRHR